MSSHAYTTRVIGAIIAVVPISILALFGVIGSSRGSGITVAIVISGALVLLIHTFFTLIRDHPGSEEEKETRGTRMLGVFLTLMVMSALFLVIAIIQEEGRWVWGTAAYLISACGIFPLIPMRDSKVKKIL